MQVWVPDHVTQHSQTALEYDGWQVALQVHSLHRWRPRWGWHMEEGEVSFEKGAPIGLTGHFQSILPTSWATSGAGAALGAGEAMTVCGPWSSPTSSTGKGTTTGHPTCTGYLTSSSTSAADAATTGTRGCAPTSAVGRLLLSCLSVWPRLENTRHRHPTMPPSEGGRRGRRWFCSCSKCGCGRVCETAEEFERHRKASHPSRLSRLARAVMNK